VIRRTVIDIRPEGPVVLQDPNVTAIFMYPPEMLNRAGAIPQELAPVEDTERVQAQPDPIYMAGVAAGLGAFFDALLAKGYTAEVANELLWAAYENTNSRGLT